MKEADIRKYAQLMTEFGLTGLEIRQDDDVIRLERSGISIPSPVQPVQVETPAPKEENGDLVTIPSPMVGVFYQAPAEDVDPFVKVGDQVSQGTVLCLIEAMKMMNEITAEADGTIVEICAKNGQVVDFGHPLFRIKR